MWRKQKDLQLYLSAGYLILSVALHGSWREVYPDILLTRISHLYLPPV